MTSKDILFSDSGITLRQLQIFAVTAAAGSITTAASQLHLSQTAVSLAIRQLEKELGSTLMIRRRAHGITLTSTGQELLPLGRNILASVAEFGRTAEDNGEVTGTVIVGCFPSLGPAMIPGLLEKFQEENPRAHFQFREAPHDELMELLEVGAVDIVLAYRMGLPTGLIEQVVGIRQVGILIAEDHPKARGRDSLSLKQLAREPYILLDTSVSSEHARHVFTAAGVYPEVRFKSTNFETVRSLIGRNMGWTITLQRPATSVTHEGHHVRVIDVEDERVDAVPVVAVRNPDLILSRASQALLDLIAREYPQNPEEREYPNLPQVPRVETRDQSQYNRQIS